MCMLLYSGLCRTCEIFSVESLVLGNLKVLEEQQFQSLSVTSEKWIALQEVSTAVGHMLVTCRSHVGHMSVTCQPHVGQMLVTCRSHARKQEGGHI